MARFKNILDRINKIRESKSTKNIELKFTKEDIFKICQIHSKNDDDKLFTHDIGYVANWLNAYLKYHIPDIKVLLYDEYIFITDNLKVTYDNIHSRYPSSKMYKYKFDFEIKGMKENDFKQFKNCGINDTIIPKCGVYIITTEKGKYIGYSVNLCKRLRNHISNDHEDRIRLPINLITIYECSDVNNARYLKEKLIYELKGGLI